MTDLGDTTQRNGRNDKLPKRNWEATYKERWFDLKFSHFVEIILTGALVGIAYFQYTVYTRQAGIKSRPQESEQDDKWSFCLTAGTLCPANQERQ
jgi:hypothetical protein